MQIKRQHYLRQTLVFPNQMLTNNPHLMDCSRVDSNLVLYMQMSNAQRYFLICTLENALNLSLVCCLSFGVPSFQPDKHSSESKQELMLKLTS